MTPDVRTAELHRSAPPPLRAPAVRPPAGADDAGGDILEAYRFIGTSPGARRVRRMISRLAGANATTLIQGETGTGKEIVALLLHRNSRRRAGPLVAVNCAAIPDAMVEGELFGYEKGAFSGAVRGYPGKFGLADGGTLFLDEIGELSLPAQAKILRAIESREIFALGAARPRRCDVRILAATHRDLAVEVAAGRFRADLFYRLAVVRLEIPPLRERRGDIPAIARRLVEELAAELGCARPSLQEDAVAVLEARSWPGNVRELRNALEHALVVAEDRQVLRAGDLPGEARGAPLAAPCEATRRTWDDTSDEALVEAIRTCGGQKARAARMLKVSRTTLYRRLARMGLETVLEG